MTRPRFIATATATLALLLATPSPGGDGWIDLLDNGLAAWQDATGWKTGDEVAVNPDNPDELIVTRPGSRIAVVETRSRAVYLLSEAQHGDIEAIIEFMIPAGSNSGIYFMGRYEIQIFDCHGREKVTHSDCGGIYQRWGPHRDEGQPPRVNAAGAPGTWQRFEVVFRAPRFDEDGRKTRNARFVKVVHNGQLIHENADVTGPTRPAMREQEPEAPLGPLRLQGDHGPVAFRTIRIRHARPDD